MASSLQVAAAPAQHLNGRETALSPLGWTEPHATWLALVCLHAGVFTAAQFSAYHNSHPSAASRFIQRLLGAGVARHLPLPGASTPEKYCHVFGKPLYRALGIPNVRHRKRPAQPVLFRRLLSLDYVAEHPHLPWLPTEAEKLHFFADRGIPGEHLPQRLYGGALKQTRRYFPLKLPIAGDDESVTFVYTDPGQHTDRQLRSWTDHHDALWARLRSAGVHVHVVVLVRTLEAQEHYDTLLRTWVPDPFSADPLAPDERTNLELIEHAIDTADAAALARWGGLSAALSIAAPLRRRADQPSPPTGRLDGYESRLARRLSADPLAP